jgi:integrase
MSSTSFIRLGYAIAHVGASWRSMNKKLEGKLGNWNPASAVDRDVIRPKRERIQDEDLPDYAARVATMRSAIKRDGLMLALYTGLRHDDVRTMRFDQVDFDDETAWRRELYRRRRAPPLSACTRPRPRCRSETRVPWQTHRPRASRARRASADRTRHRRRPREPFGVERNAARVPPDAGSPLLAKYSPGSRFPKGS